MKASVNNQGEVLLFPDDGAERALLRRLVDDEEIVVRVPDGVESVPYTVQPEEFINPGEVRRLRRELTEERVRREEAEQRIPKDDPLVATVSLNLAASANPAIAREDLAEIARQYERVLTKLAQALDGDDESLLDKLDDHSIRAQDLRSVLESIAAAELGGDG